MMFFSIALLEGIIKYQGGSYHSFFTFNIAIDIGGTPHCLHAAVVMNMTEDMKPGTDALYCCQEIGTAVADSTILIHDAAGRDVSDENVGISRNQ